MFGLSHNLQRLKNITSLPKDPTFLMISGNTINGSAYPFLKDFSIIATVQKIDFTPQLLDSYNNYIPTCFYYEDSTESWYLAESSLTRTETED